MGNEQTKTNTLLFNLKRISLLFMIVISFGRLMAITDDNHHPFFIDDDLKHGDFFLQKMHQFSDVYNLFSHGKPGMLRIDGEWKNAEEISDFLMNQNLISVSHINIFGCEFAKGEIGRQAVSYLQRHLGIAISASDDITGKDGDWELEVGKYVSFSDFSEYEYNLQYGPSDDFDGDGKINSVDLDDDNDGILDVDECDIHPEVNEFGYKDGLLIASYHAVLATTTNNEVVGWGAYLNNDGVSDLQTPTVISPANGYNFSGTILKYTLASSNDWVNEAAILTDNGLYAWGFRRRTFNTSTAEFPIVPIDLKEEDQNAFAKIQNTTTAESTSPANVYSLPESYVPDEVTYMNATYQSLYIVTSDGKLWVLGANAFNYGDGTTTSDSLWHRVQIPNNEKIRFVKMTQQSAFAYTDAGKFYTWGRYTFLGSGSITQRLFPTLMINPLSGAENVAQITMSSNGVISSSTSTRSTYFILSTSGEVYSLGGNGRYQAGRGTALYYASWGKVTHQDNSVLTNVRFINGTENATQFASVSVILDDGTIRSWGANDEYQIGGPDTGNDEYHYPIIPAGTLGKQVVNVNAGGHITPLIDAAGDICNVGHDLQFSFGDGMSTGEEITSYKCDAHVGVNIESSKSSSSSSESCDYDGDGIPNQFDRDSDGDQCPDALEGNGNITSTQLNPDGSIAGGVEMDGVPSDANGGQSDVSAYNDAVTSEECDPCNPSHPAFLDSDGDGIGNICDIDDDNDGILDIAENYYFIDPDSDLDGDGVVNYLDDYPYTPEIGDANGMIEREFDADGDGVMNHVDLDSDNDGIPDIVEAGGTDTNGDGKVDGLNLDETLQNDLDKDGLADEVDNDTSSSDPMDSEGIPNIEIDNEGIPNSQDLDSDGDGIVDAKEGDQPDTDGNGIVDGVEDASNDSNGNGWYDSADPTEGDGISYPPTNTDGHGEPDFLDLDADNDGILDNSEAQPTDSYITPTEVHQDDDGIDDIYDNDLHNYGGSANNGITPENTDGTDQPDYRDLDSDNDGASDVEEGGFGGLDINGDGVIDGGMDGDHDGLLDGADEFEDPVGYIEATQGGLTPDSYPNDHNPETDERDWREKRPDLTPDICIAPNQLSKKLTTQLVRILIEEVNGTATDGSAIQVSIPVATSYSVKPYENTLTEIEGLPVQNSEWTYLGIISGEHMWQYSGSGGIINGFGTSAFGFEIDFDTNNLSGELNIITSIPDGSGGELNAVNNSDGENIKY